MKRAALTLCIFAAFGGCVATPANVDPMPEVILLMGQSNMSGHGKLEEMPEWLSQPDPRIQMLGNDGVVKIASEPLDSTDGQIDEVSKDGRPRVGPALAFAKNIVAAGRASRILLVPCAKGGTRVAQWHPDPSRETLYGSCLARARQARTSGRLSAILWYQGESDTQTEATAAAWAPTFVDMISEFRSDLGKPNLRLIVIGLADAPSRASQPPRSIGWQMVQDAQRRLQLPNQQYVSAAGLPVNPDSDDIHLSTAGQIELGKRLAEIW